MVLTFLVNIVFAGSPMDVLETKGIEIGISKVEVLKILGKPSMKDKLGKSSQFLDGISKGKGGEAWYYQVKDRMDMQWLCNFIFKDNKLVAIYGKEKSRIAPSGKTEWIRLK